MRSVIRFFALLKMTASRCLCAVGAGLVPALCLRGVLFWAPTRDAPTGAVLCYLYSVLFRADTPVPPLQALYSVICTLYSSWAPTRGCPLRVLMRFSAFDLVAVRIDE